MRPDIIVISGGARLFVPREDAQRALDVLAELDTAAPEDESPGDAGI